MARYARCPNCRNSEEGDELLKCVSCGEVYCERCAPKSECDHCLHEWGSSDTGLVTEGFITAHDD